jgi:hypothetical protein
MPSNLGPNTLDNMRANGVRTLAGWRFGRGGNRVNRTFGLFAKSICVVYASLYGGTTGSRGPSCKLLKQFDEGGRGSALHQLQTLTARQLTPYGVSIRILR